MAEAKTSGNLPHFSDKVTEAEDRAAKQDKTTRPKTASKPGLSLEMKIDLEKQKKYLLIKEHNRLTFAVKEKEAKLKELQVLLEAKSPQSPHFNSEDALKQHIRQLENNLEKMKIKILAASKIQTAYQNICQHLQQELCGLSVVLDQRELDLVAGLTKLDKATKDFKSTAASAGSTLEKKAQVEGEMMEKKREMDNKLYELIMEEKHLKKKMETLALHTLSRQSREDELVSEEEEKRSTFVSGHKSDPEFCKNYIKHPNDRLRVNISGASQADVKLVEDMESLTEALGCSDVQDLVNKVVSQRATREQLHTEIIQHEEQMKQEAKTLADLELQYTKVKFGVSPATERCDKLKEEMQEKLKQEVNQEVNRVQRLQAELKQTQDLLDTVELGINNLYFRLSCVPVEGLSSAPVTDIADKLKDIRLRLPVLLQKISEQEPEISSLYKEKLVSLLEQQNTMEMRNNRRPTTPADTLQLSDDEEEEGSLSRDEIKRRSNKLIESRQKF